MTLQERWMQEIKLKPCKITIKKKGKEKNNNGMYTQYTTPNRKI